MRRASRAGRWLDSSDYLDQQGPLKMSFPGGARTAT
jgi:hypothetical protein